MISTKKFFFLPFIDNLTAVGVTLLIVFLFGSWMQIPAFSAVATFFMLLTLCGRIYIRMWKLSKSNTLRHYGLTKNDFIKFIMPLVVFDIVLALFYCLCEFDILPLKDVIVKSYYDFPDDAKRELVNISLFEYIAVAIKLWFMYFLFILKNGLMLFLAPILSFASCMLGYHLGKKNIEISNGVLKVTEKAKDKFNE